MSLDVRKKSKMEPNVDVVFFVLKGKIDSVILNVRFDNVLI